MPRHDYKRRSCINFFIIQLTSHGATDSRVTPSVPLLCHLERSREV